MALSGCNRIPVLLFFEVKAVQKTYVEGESLEEFRLAASAGNIGILFFRASALPFVQVISLVALMAGSLHARMVA